jgi:hypothetical protein
VPVTPAFPAPAKLPIPPAPVVPVVAQAGLLDVVVGEVVGETVGIVGTNELGPTVPTMGKTPVVGTAGAEPTPRLPISKDPNGIPVRALPPSVVGDVDVGLDDAAMLLEPEPHVPDVPDVSSIPEDVDIPGGTDGTDISNDVDVPGVVVGSVVAAVAGAAVPAAVPPPS